MKSKSILNITFLGLCLLCSSLKTTAQEEINIDSLKIQFNKVKDLYQRTETTLQICKYYNRADIDSNAKYLGIAKGLIDQLQDDKLTARYYLHEGNNFKNTGSYIKSVASYEKAINSAEKVKDTLTLAKVYNSMGLVYKRQGGDNQGVGLFLEKALMYENRALKLYESINDTTGLLRVYSNLGIIYRDQKDFKAAESSFLQGLAIAKEVGIESYSIGILNANLSQIYLDYYKDHNRAIELLWEAIRIYEKNGIRTSMEHAYRNISYNYTGKKEYAKAIEFANKAIDIAEEVDDDHRRINAYSSLYFAQKSAGLFEESLANYEHVRSIEDSLLSIEKTAIIAEMDAKFETVKKDARIKVLNANAELDRLRLIAISLGAALLLALAIGIIVNLVQRRKREQIISEKEKTIESEKLKNAKIALEHKQKELTAKVLQLARKNEFLNTVEKEINRLQENVDTSVNKVSSRVTRLIENDLRNDEQWEQFAVEFSHLNKGFLDKLIATYGSFSKSEIRLISLLKMNLSSKDIADTLNISEGGIKKARYRLRKKIDLNSEDDIQGYLLSFS